MKFPTRFIFSKSTKSDIPQYTDKSEEFLLKLFSLTPSKRQKHTHQILNQPDKYPVLYYHLSPQRHFLLSPINITPKDTVLELGAGCGAVTGYLCQKAKHVTAIELNPLRAKIIKQRHRNHHNLKVIIGNLKNYQPLQKFDFIILIGLLEYAGRFFQPQAPHILYPPIKLLKHIKPWLKPKGHIIIGIENKLGYKYIMGKYEDHYYKRRFESINNYPHYNGIATFSKNELVEIFHQAGFKTFTFFYPFPDYKHPTLILDDSTINDSTLPTYLIPYSTQIPTSKIKPPIKERLFIKSLIKERLLAQFSNSFLISLQK